MNILRNFRKPIASVLAVVMTLVAAPLMPVHATIVGTDEIVSHGASATDSAREKVDAFMARSDVRARMEGLGVSPDEAAARIGALSDEEIRQIAGKIDEMPAGEGLGAVLGAIVIVLLILVLTDLLGLTHVFGFTNKGALRQ